MIWKNKSDADEEIEKFEFVYSLLYSSFESYKCYSFILQNLNQVKGAYNILNKSVNSALNEFKMLEKNFESVHQKMFGVYNLCETHASDILELEKHEKELKGRLNVFESLESITSKLNSPLLNVEDESFQALVENIEKCILFIENEVLYKQLSSFLTSL